MHLPIERMKPSAQSTSPLDDLIQRQALFQARGQGARLGFLAFTVISLLTAFFIWLESFRYFPPGIKVLFLAVMGALVLLILLMIFGYYWLMKNQRLPQSKPENIAKLIGDEVPDVGDRVLNAVQLHAIEPEQGISASLQSAAVQAGIKVMEQIPPKLLFPKTRLKTYLIRLSLGVGVVLFLYLLNFQESNAAIKRISQPQVQFDYPLPLNLFISSDTQTVLAGDTLEIWGRVEGRQVGSLEMIIQTAKDTSRYQLAVEDQQFKFPVEHPLASFTAFARVSNDKPWEPWMQIVSDPLRIRVINRPLIQDLNLRIRPPAYTRMPVEIHTRDILDIIGYKGSTVSISGLTSKAIETALLHFDHAKTIKAQVTGNHFKAGFVLTDADNLWFELKDDEGMTNSDPLVYPIYVARDIAPLIRVLIPGQDVIIGENMLIPTRLKLDDDFGFSKLVLNYRIQHPDYLMADTNTYAMVLDLLQPDLASQELNFQWDVSQISIMPEDALLYWFTVWDNNAVDGPAEASSKQWLARLPSLDEMFEELARGNETIKQEQAEILDVVKEIREKVDELALEVQKDPDLSWDQQQEAAEAVQQVEDLKTQLENISQQLDEMVSSAEQQNLFSEETLDKYSELQQLMEQLITPELREAMEKLQQALDQDDPGDMEAALEDFQAALENFQKSLERTLEIFKQVELEQKIDELSSRLNDLAERQEALIEALENMNPPDAAQVEQKIARDFNKAEETAESLKELLDQNEDLPSEWVQELQDQMALEQIDQNLEMAASQMQQGQITAAKSPAEQAAGALRKLAQQAQQMQGKLQQMMMDQVLSAYRSILLKTLRLSQNQEELEQKTRTISRQSSLLRDYADSQMNLMQGLKQVAVELKELGEKTFSVSSSMGRSMGASQAHMQAAIRQMEARNTSQSAQSQVTARENLNRMAMQIASAMEALQQSGEASGFSDYMEQLMQMAGQQQGLNQQTMMQLGKGSQSIMQELARRQLQLREALSQIEKGMGSDSRMLGDLNKIGQEMEQVARELTRKRPSQRIHEQQERILSRLLDAQRSATQRDFSKKRKSETGTYDQAWRGSKTLPEDLGEARNMLYEELIFSLKQDYDRGEQALIREYFNLLEAELNE